MGTDLAVRGDPLSFFDPAVFEDGVGACNWNLSEMLAALVEIARDTENKPADRMQAIRMLDAKAKEVIGAKSLVATEVYGGPGEPPVKERRVEVLQATSTRTMQALDAIEESNKEEPEMEDVSDGTNT